MKYEQIPDWFKRAVNIKYEYDFNKNTYHFEANFCGQFRFHKYCSAMALLSENTFTTVESEMKKQAIEDLWVMLVEEIQMYVC